MAVKSMALESLEHRSDPLNNCDLGQVDSQLLHLLKWHGSHSYPSGLVLRIQ